MYKYIAAFLLVLFAINGSCHANDEQMLDAEFVSFQQTKDIQHLKTILEFVKNQDDNVLFLAYEWKNREFIQNMLASIGRKLPENYSGDDALMQQIANHQDYDKIVLTRWVMEYLQSIQETDPSIKQMGKALIAKDPKLDYWKRVFKMIGYPVKPFSAF